MLSWIHKNKLRLLVTLVITFMLSLILPLSLFVNFNDMVELWLFLSPFSIVFWFVIYNLRVELCKEMSKDLLEFIKEGFVVIGNLIIFIIYIAIGLGMLFIAVKVIKFMWIM